MFAGIIFTLFVLWIIREAWRLIMGYEEKADKAAVQLIHRKGAGYIRRFYGKGYRW